MSALIAAKDVEEHGQGDVAERLSGISYDEVRALLDSTVPYEVAAANWDLTPAERLAAVHHAQYMIMEQE
jgi:hypothetical protein